MFLFHEFYEMIKSLSKSIIAFGRKNYFDKEDVIFISKNRKERRCQLLSMAQWRQLKGRKRAFQPFSAPLLPRGDTWSIILFTWSVSKSGTSTYLWRCNGIQLIVINCLILRNIEWWLCNIFQLDFITILMYFYWYVNICLRHDHYDIMAHVNKNIVFAFFRGWYYTKMVSANLNVVSVVLLLLLWYSYCPSVHKLSHDTLLSSLFPMNYNAWK